MIVIVFVNNQQEKPQGHYPAVPPCPWGVKDIIVTQDTRSSLCSKRRDEYVWTGGLGQVTTKKWKIKKTRKAPGALTLPLFSLPLGSKIYYGHLRYKPSGVNFKSWRFIVFFTRLR